jgi:hypothetical protein
VVAGGEQLWHEIALPIRASEVIAVDLKLLGTGDRSRKRVLTTGVGTAMFEIQLRDEKRMTARVAWASAAGSAPDISLRT